MIGNDEFLLIFLIGLFKLLFVPFLIILIIYLTLKKK